MIRWFQQARPEMRADLLHRRVVFLDYEAKLQYGLDAQWGRQRTLQNGVSFLTTLKNSCFSEMVVVMYFQWVWGLRADRLPWTLSFCPC